jgi:hypothetical protein
MKRRNYMKKKSSAFILVLIAFLVFSNTGYAKSVSKKINAIFGSYVIKVNGKAQNTETLANGSKVYVPINDLTKLTGAAVKKTGTTYAITPVVKEDGVTKKQVDAVKKELAKVQNDLDDVQLKVQFMNQYKLLEDFTVHLYMLSEYLDMAYFEISESGATGTLNETLQYYNDLNELLADLTKAYAGIETTAKKEGFDYKEDSGIVKEIIAVYEDSLELMDESLDLLGEYAKTSNETLADESFNKSSSALDLAYDAEELSLQGYSYYLGEISGK